LIPLSGQGLLLPQDCPYSGAWIQQNSLFLYQSAQGVPINSEGPTVGFHLNDGTVCHGINAATLSVAFGMDAEQLFAANLMGRLILISASNTTSFMGMRYVFNIGTTNASVTIKYG
jgi:hypothetical protein